jgi:hypothetical protein
VRIKEAWAHGLGRELAAFHQLPTLEERRPTGGRRVCPRDTWRGVGDVQRRGGRGRRAGEEGAGDTREEGAGVAGAPAATTTH